MTVKLLPVEADLQVHLATSCRGRGRTSVSLRFKPLCKCRQGGTEAAEYALYFLKPAYGDCHASTSIHRPCMGIKVDDRVICEVIERQSTSARSLIAEEGEVDASRSTSRWGHAQDCAIRVNCGQNL